MQAFHQFAAAYHEFLFEQRAGVVYRAAQHIAHAEELWFFLVDDAAVGIDARFAIGKGIQGIDGLVARGAGGEVYMYFGLGGGVVLHLAYFDFTLFVGFEYGVDKGACRVFQSWHAP